MLKELEVYSSKLMIKDIVKTRTIEAMKNQDSKSLLVLRGLSAALEYKRGQVLRDLTEEEEVAVLKSEYKKRMDAIAIYKDHGQADRVAIEEAEAALIKEFLPEEIDEAIVKSKVQELIDGGVTNKGMLIGQVIGFFGKDKVDGTVVARIVNETFK